MTHPVYREECKKKRGRIPCWWAGTEEREREENPRKGRASTTTTSNKKGRKRDRKKIEAWLKARRVLTMADDFQLLLSPSREWKMENPNAGYIYIYIYIYTELIYFESFSRASLHLFSPAFTVFSVFFSSFEEIFPHRGSSVKRTPANYRWRFHGFCKLKDYTRSIRREESKCKIDFKWFLFFNLLSFRYL